MVKKQGNLKNIFLVFLIIEVSLVILSNNFQKNLEIGFDQGRLVIRNVKGGFDLQETITADFQKDEYLLLSNEIKLTEIPDFNLFVATLFSTHPVMKKIVSSLSPENRQLLLNKDISLANHQMEMIINNINEKVINNNKFCELQFTELLDNSSAEENFLLQEFQSRKVLSPLDTARLNRIIIEKALTEKILAPQENVPAIYGSYKLYNFFRQIFGEGAALNAFYLIRMLLIIDIIFITAIILIRKSLAHFPSKAQVVVEMLYNAFEGLVRDTIGNKLIYYTPYIVTIFLFVWISNMMGLFPIPGFMEPTRNLNVPLGLGIIVFCVVHFTAFREKGIWGHLQNFVNPVKNPLAILDIVSEISKIVSISFRLFGNILGGAIIFVVVSSLVKFVVFPVGLNLFFGLFVGTVQAFVFTMLALTYISMHLSE
jgi:F-type H+-transporting ATPase subunit a